MRAAYKIHKLINRERKKRGLKPVFWSKKLAKLAHGQVKYCAKVRKLVHSKRYAFRGGENLAMGGINFSPRAVVSCWLHSKMGHREYLLSSRVTKAGVGIVKSHRKTYVAWAFSDEFVFKSLNIPKKIKNFIRRISNLF